MPFSFKNRLIVSGARDYMQEFYSSVQDVATFSLLWHSDPEQEEKCQLLSVQKSKYLDEELDVTFTTIGTFPICIPDIWVDNCTDDYPELTFKLYFYNDSHYGYKFSTVEDTNLYEIQFDNNDDEIENPVYDAYIEKYFRNASLG